MKEITLETIAVAVTKACRDLPVALAYLYGSQATSQTHAESDIDIAVAFTRPDEDRELLMQLFTALGPLYGLYPERLDLTDFSRLPLPVRFRVIRDGQLLYVADEQLHRRLVLDTAAQYHDQRPLVEQYNRVFFARASTV